MRQQVSVCVTVVCFPLSRWFENRNGDLPNRLLAYQQVGKAFYFRLSNKHEGMSDVLPNANMQASVANTENVFDLQCTKQKLTQS